MTQYVKRPIVIEAEQVPDIDKQAHVEFFNKLEAMGANSAPDKHITRGVDHLLITTLEGVMRADVGDWIIKGVQGELYPCKPGIFAATYDRASKLPPPGESWHLKPSTPE